MQHVVWWNSRHNSSFSHQQTVSLHHLTSGIKVVKALNERKLHIAHCLNFFKNFHQSKRSVSGRSGQVTEAWTGEQITIHSFKEFELITVLVYFKLRYMKRKHSAENILVVSCKYLYDGLCLVSIWYQSSWNKSKDYSSMRVKKVWRWN